LAVRTPSSNGPARLSLVAGLAGVAVLPAAIALAQVSRRYELLQAWVAIPAAAALGIAALLLARSARERLRRTIGRVGGERSARAGRALGRLAVAMAISGAIAVGVYEALTRWAE
jgi:peptidoglycan/LPS O-acetylase OafA/YrhL